MDPDRELVARCQIEAGERGAEAFRDLYDRYKDRIYNIAYRITGSAPDALDASQETFAILFRKIRNFRFDSRFSSWLYRIAVNASIDLMRRTSTRKIAAGEGIAEETPSTLEHEHSHESNPSRELGNRELEQEVQAAIGKLSPKLRTIVVLRYVEGLSYEAISEVLECSIGTVKSRLARAHMALEKSLSKVLDDHYYE
jgi:RNA polymerase sigma-70 factor (ECF subfamily)